MDAKPSVALAERKQLSEKALFTAFLHELASEEPDEDTMALFQEAWHHAEQEGDN